MGRFFFTILSGNLFHIDFGYILGRDPKPLPPPMKLSKEMVNIECDFELFELQGLKKNPLSCPNARLSTHFGFCCVNAVKTP